MFVCSLLGFEGENWENKEINSEQFSTTGKKNKLRLKPNLESITNKDYIPLMTNKRGEGGEKGRKRGEEGGGGGGERGRKKVRESGEQKRKYVMNLRGKGKRGEFVQNVREKEVERIEGTDEGEEKKEPKTREEINSLSPEVCWVCYSGRWWRRQQVRLSSYRR